LPRRSGGGFTAEGAESAERCEERKNGNNDVGWSYWSSEGMVG
jgi:hypothetical protein